MASSSIQEFFPDTENVRFYASLLKAQGVDVCQNKLKVMPSSSTPVVGFISKVYDSVVWGQDPTVHGFVLCRMDENNKEMAWIDVVCSRENSKIGRVLMEMMEEYCRSITSIKIIQLMCLPEPKLKKWYVDLGFIASEITIWDGKKPKAYLMQKFL